MIVPIDERQIAPHFVAVFALAHIAQLDKGERVLPHISCLCACYQCHSVGENAPWPPQTIRQDVKAAHTGNVNRLVPQLCRPCVSQRLPIVLCLATLASALGLSWGTDLSKGLSC